jgi:hypothetical protein
MSDEQLPIAPHTASEFYAWLWWSSEQSEGKFDLGGDIGKIELWVDDRIAFRIPASNKPSAVMTGDNPGASLESRAALAGGKVLHDIRVAVRRDDREFAATLKGPGMDLQRVRLPQAIEGTGEDALYDRMFLYEELQVILGALFKQFAAARAAKMWDKTVLPALKEWVAGRA